MGSSAPSPVEPPHTDTPFHTHTPPAPVLVPPGPDSGSARLRVGPWQGATGPAHRRTPPGDQRLSSTGAPGAGMAVSGVPAEHPQHHTVEQALRERALATGGAPAEHPQHPQQHAVELTLRERALAAGAAAVLSAVVMNPLDVAKTRLQAQAAGYSYSQAVGSGPCNKCGSPWPDPITRRHLASYQLSWLSPASDVGGFRDAPHPHPRAAMNVSRAGLPFAAAGGAACQVSCDFPAPSSKAYRGPLDVVTRIIREEGASRLWRGTSAGLLMAVPTVGIYMPVYDSLRERLEEGSDSWTAAYAPLIAGAVSRSLSCVLCAPLELARTRLQATSQSGPGAPPGAPSAGLGQSSKGVLGVLREALHGEGLKDKAGAHGRHATGAAARPIDAFAQVARLRVLWRGVDAHLARDVPFSAICWSALEPMRKALLAVGAGDRRGEGEWGRSVEEREQSVGLGRVVAANFTAGVVAGSFAAAVTTPLDVAKTRVQIEICADSAGRGVVYHLREVYREGGWRALYAGAGPRSLKAGPSVGIIVSFYEIMKCVFSKRLHHEH